MLSKVATNKTFVMNSGMSLNVLFQNMDLVSWFPFHNLRDHGLEEDY